MADFPFQFRPHREGLRAILGDLESAVMELVWHQGPLTVRETHDLLNRDRDLAYTTVMTVMSRLAEKGLLRKRKSGQAYRYRAAMSREQFTRKTLTTIMGALVSGFGSPALSTFVESVGREKPGKMAELAAILAKKREEGLE